MKGRFLLAGGSGGLGQAAVRLLASEGADLVVSFCTNRERAATLQGEAKVLQADITRNDDRARLLEEAGPIDGLVVFTGNPARVSSPAEIEHQMSVSHAVNYMGPLLLAREAADRMRQARIAGAIVLFSTMQGVGLFPNSSVYAGAKAALIHGARILAKELRSDNIRVNVIAPGIMAAGMAEASIASGKYDRYLSDGIISRFGRAEDIAKTVRFLLEPDNYITGQVISVDGGITL
jgi:3-oxoacyl-[acyl-carrier protein] reductase